MNYLRVLEKCQTKRGEVIKSTCISNTTEEPLETTPNKAKAQVFSKTFDLVPVVKTILREQVEKKTQDIVRSKRD